MASLHSLYFSALFASTNPPAPPPPPALAHSDYTDSPCDSGTETHVVFTPVNTCVNQTNSVMSEDDMYYDGVSLTAASKMDTCVDGGVKEVFFADPGCVGSPIKTEDFTQSTGTCMVQKGDSENPDLHTTVMCYGGEAPPSAPPSSSFAVTIDFDATQVSFVAVLLCCVSSLVHSLTNPSTLSPPPPSSDYQWLRHCHLQQVSRCRQHGHTRGHRTFLQHQDAYCRIELDLEPEGRFLRGGCGGSSAQSRCRLAQHQLHCEGHQPRSGHKLK